jgi:hypothetical protein
VGVSVSVVATFNASFVVYDFVEGGAEFLAAFPPIQSAITFHGSGGMRIQLDISESDLGEAAKELLWRAQLLRVSIVPIEVDEADDKLESIGF